MTVLVGDFANHTGDPLLDGTLEPMLGEALEGASFINVYSRGDARKLAMKLPNPTDKLDEQSARLVAVNQSVNVVVTGDISLRGDEYDISAIALDAVSGKIVAKAASSVPISRRSSKSFPKLAAPIRKVLGDTTPASVQFDRQPTDVTWDTQGNIFISDGYVNSRVAKFDKNGDWVKQWGTPGSGQGEFNTPHSIASDAKGNIYVADRGNRRIQVFDPDGTFLREITIDVPVPPVVHMWMGNPPAPQPPSTVGAAPPNGTMQPGAPWAICINPGPTQYIYSADAYPGRIYKLTLEGKVVGVFGSMGRQPKQFGWVHEIACPAENEIYTAEILNWRVQKLILNGAVEAPHRSKTTPATKSD